MIDAKMDARIAESIMRTGGEPDTLDAKQLDLAHEPLTRSLEPEPARACVRHDEQSIETEVDVTAWTAQAVAIRWPGPDGAEHRAWVWADAVSQRLTTRGLGLHAQVSRYCRAMTTAGAIIFGVALVLVIGGSIVYIRVARSSDDGPRVQRRVLAIVALGLAIGIAIALARMWG